MSAVLITFCARVWAVAQRGGGGRENYAVRRGTGVILSTRIYLLEMPLPRCVRGSDAGANSVLKPRPQEEHAATGETSLSHGRFVPVSTPPGAVSQMRLST